LAVYRRVRDEMRAFIERMPETLEGGGVKRVKGVKTAK
jgi:hypothetical protein